MSAPVIRRGRREDSAFLAWVMLYSARAHLHRGIWDLLIGADEAGCLDFLQRLSVAEPRSLCHYESFWVAETDGQPAAALCTFELPAGGWASVTEAISGVQRELGWTPADLGASRRRTAPVWACFLPDGNADWAIESVATRPGFRGRGLATALVRRALQEGGERGRTLAQIETFIGNRVARLVYEKCGFRFSGEKRCVEIDLALGTPGFLRLIREL